MKRRIFLNINKGIRRRLQYIINLVKYRNQNIIGLKYANIEKNVIIKTNKNGKIIFKGGLTLRTGCELFADGGTIEVGSGCYLNRNNIIVSHEKIAIHNGSTIGPFCMIYDHDHDIYEKGQYNCSPVVIENNCWIGGNTTILRGTTIGESSIIAASSLVNMDICKHSLFYNKREKIVIHL